MSNELQEYKQLETKVIDSYINDRPEYSLMTKEIQNNLPQILKTTENFNKTQSQFMDNMLTVAHPTPIRNIRQILAEMNKTRMALQEAYIKCSRKEVQIEIKLNELEMEKDSLKQELINIDIIELRTELNSTKGYIGGAIRKMANYNEQYKSILASLGKESLTEEDFEREEEQYHIMKAFDQATIAARSRNFFIDEGNMIYLTQLGINGGVAQKEVSNYLHSELTLIKEGRDPGYEYYLSFLNSMYEKFKGCSTKFAQLKGMTGTTSQIALLKEE